MQHRGRNSGVGHMNSESERPIIVDTEDSLIINVEKEYQRASIIKAKEHLVAASLRNEYGEKYPLCSTSPRELSVFSLGINLYFKFLKQMGCLFSLIFLLSLPSLYFNITGEYITKEESNSILDKTTLGNRVWETEESSYWSNSENQKFLTIWLDIISCVLTMIILQFMLCANNRAKSTAHHNIATPGDYTIKVQGIPPTGVDEDDVKEFFQKRYLQVVEVKFARKFGGILSEYKKLYNLDKIIGIAEKRSANGGGESSNKVQKLERKREKLHTELQQSIHRVRVIEDLECLHAYVTFNSVKSKIACLLDYSNWSDSLCLCMQPQKLRLFDRYPLRYIYIYIYNSY